MFEEHSSGVHCITKIISVNFATSIDKNQRFCKQYGLYVLAVGKEITYEKGVRYGVHNDGGFRILQSIETNNHAYTSGKAA
jgi:hypothetical protein